MLPPLPFVVAFLTLVVTLVPLSYWVYSDAIARGSSFPSFWGVTAVLFWPAGLYYLIRYRHLHERRHPPTRGNRIAFIVALSSFSTMFAGPFLAPPDPFTQIFYWVAVFAATLLVTYLLVYRRQSKRAVENA